MPSISLQFQNWAIHTLARITQFSASDVWKYIGIASNTGQVLYCFLFRLKLMVSLINTICLEKQTFGKYACNYHVKSCNHWEAYPLLNPFMLYHGKWNLIHENSFLSLFWGCLLPSEVCNLCYISWYCSEKASRATFMNVYVADKLKPWTSCNMLFVLCTVVSIES